MKNFKRLRKIAKLKKQILKTSNGIDKEFLKEDIKKEVRLYKGGF